MRLYDRTETGVYLIAEMSANHAGRLDDALRIVREAAAAGADCLKIQTYTADTLTLDSDKENFRIHGGLWDGRRLHELYREAATPWEWHGAIRDACRECGVDFLSTPFDRSAVDFLDDLGVEFFKIASFELVDLPLIRHAASKGKPMVMSCGMAAADEIQDAVDACRSQGNDRIVLLKCCSEYPARLEDMNLATISDMRARFGVPVGFSDHSMGSAADVVAVALGACVIEKHFCLSRAIRNPDSEFSMEPAEFAQMARDVRIAAAIRGRVTYRPTPNEQKSSVFRRSLFTTRDIAAGETFTADNLRSVRPGLGVKPAYLEDLLGRKAACAIEGCEPLLFHHVETPDFLLRLKTAAFQSDRLRMEGISAADADRIVAWRSDEEIVRYFKNPAKVDRATHDAWFARYLVDAARFDFLVREEDTGEPVGIVGIQNVDLASRSAEIAYLIAARRRQGFGREAVEAMVGFAVRRLRLQDFTAVVREDNAASVRLIERAGFTLRAEDRRDGWATYRYRSDLSL